MALFDNFPYTNFHELNLDYILKKMQELETQFQELQEYIDSSVLVEDVQTKQGGDWVTAVTDKIAKIPVSDSGVSGTVTSEEIATIAEGAAPIQHVEVYENGAWTNIVDGNGDAKLHISGGMLPASGVTAGTYGDYPVRTESTMDHIYNMTVDSNGRITAVNDAPIPFIRTAVGSIPAGEYRSNIYFDTTNYPWYDNACFVNVNVYEYISDGKGNYFMSLLAPGTDYTMSLGNESMSVALTATKSNPVYIVVNGSYGERTM